MNLRGLQIYIPTYRRVRRQKTWSWLTEELRERTALVCVRDEAEALKRVTGGRVLVQPASVQTISAKRQWIVDQCKSDYLVMLDDDLNFAVRDPVRGQGKSDKNQVKLNACKPKDMNRLFTEMRAQLDTHAHASISMRMANRGMVPGWHPCKRAVYVLAYHVPTLRAFARFDAIAHREDMWVTLKLLEAGFANSVSFEFSADQVYASAGGESAAGRTMKASNRDAEALAAEFPELVKAGWRTYKEGIDRIEVTVQWNKAWSQHLA